MLSTAPVFAAMALALIVDQAAKALVARRLPDGSALLVGRVGIRPVWNRRPFGSRTGNGRTLLMWLAVAIVAIVALVLTGVVSTLPARLALGGALGGAAGNVRDRRSRGGVFDFLDAGPLGVFNFADVFITGGIAIGLIFR